MGWLRREEETIIGDLTCVVTLGATRFSVSAPVYGDVMLSVEDGEPVARYDGFALRKQMLRSMRAIQKGLSGQKGIRLWEAAVSAAKEAEGDA